MSETLTFTSKAGEWLTTLTNIMPVIDADLAIMVEDGRPVIHFVDLAHVMFGIIHMPTTELTGDLERITVDVSGMVSALKSFGKTDDVTFSTESGGFLTLKGGRKTRKIPLLWESSLNVTSPKYRPDSWYNADSEVLVDVIGDVARDFESCVFENQDGAWHIRSVSKGVVGTYDANIGAEGGEAGVNALYSTDYLKHISKLVKGAGSIQFHVGTDLPLSVRTDNAFFLLAPRIERS